MSRYNIGEAVVSVSLEKICNVFAHIASFKLIHVNRIFLQQFLDCLLLASRKRVWTEKLLGVKQYTATDRPQSNVWQWLECLQFVMCMQTKAGAICWGVRFQHNAWGCWWWNNTQNG